MNKIFNSKKIIIIIAVILVIIVGILIFKFKNNTDNKVNEENLKSEFTTFQNELDLYLAELDSAKYNPQLICANTDNIICGTVKIGNDNIYDIIPSLEKSEYKDFVNVANGKLEVKRLSKEEIAILETFMKLAEYDYSYCITDYKKANNLNKTDIVDNVVIQNHEIY